MYHEDISNNYTSLTYPEFSQSFESAKDMAAHSSYDGKPSLPDNNQYNQFNSNSSYNINQSHARQNFDYKNFNAPYNQSTAPSNYNQANQYNQFNQNQYNQFQGQYDDSNFYSQNQNYGDANNYRNNFNSFHPQQPYCEGRPPPSRMNQGKYNNYQQPFNDFDHSESINSSRYSDSYMDEDQDERNFRGRDNMRGDYSDRGNRGRNEDWRGPHGRHDNYDRDEDYRRRNDSEQESDTSYDSDTGATKTVYINNVYQKWTEKDIENSIRSHGIVVKSVRIIPRKKAGSGRSFAFADFYKVSEAEKWMDVTQSRLLFPDETIAYLEYSEQCRNKAITKRRDRGADRRERTPPKRGRDGDWSCSKCDFWNFKWRDNCFRCSNNKSDKSRSRSRSDDEDVRSNDSRKRFRHSPENEYQRKKERIFENDNIAPNQNPNNVSYPMEGIGVELKYDYNSVSSKPTNITNTASVTPSGTPKIKKQFQEDLWEKITENDLEPPGGFKAPLPPIINKKKFESGNRTEKLPIEVKLKVDGGEKLDAQQPTTELVASYGDSDSDEEDAGDEHLVDTTKLVCLLCKRAFMNQQTLKKHQTHSQLHKDNLAEYKKKLIGSAIINTNPLKKL